MDYQYVPVPERGGSRDLYSEVEACIKSATKKGGSHTIIINLNTDSGQAHVAVLEQRRHNLVKRAVG